MTLPGVDWSHVEEAGKLETRTFDGMLDGSPLEIAAKSQANGFSYGVEAGWRAAMKKIQEGEMDAVVADILARRKGE